MFSQWKNYLESKEAAPQQEPGEMLLDDEFQQACQLFARLAVLAQRYGVSYVSLSALFAQLPRMFGFQGQVLAAPPLLFLEFWRPTDAEPYRLTSHLGDASFNLTKLSNLAALAKDLGDGNISIAQAHRRLDQIDTLPPPYRSSAVALGYSLCGAGFAVLLSMTWQDTIFAALLSLFVFAIVASADRSHWLANRINFTSALVSSLLANIGALVVPGSDPSNVALCAVIVLIPGLSLTLGIIELASKKIISGLDRLIDGMLITLVLVVGNAVGVSMVKLFWTIPPTAATPDYPLPLTFVCVILLMLGLAIIFQVRRQDLVWVVLAGAIAYTGVVIGRQFGEWQGSFVGALLLGLYTSLIANKRRLPSSVIMLPGVMILVPGVAAYTGVDVLQNYGIIGALPTVWGVMVQIGAIMGGLYVAASIVPRNVAL